MNRLPVLIGPLIVAVALAACGGPATPAANAPVAASSSRLRHITMVQAVTAPAYSPVVVAQKAGIFAKHGLQVTIVPLEASSTAAQALVGGSAQFDAGVASDALLADSKGNHLVAIATLGHRISLDLEVSQKWAESHHFDPAAPLPDRLKALKGAKIGITAPGSITDLTVRYMLQTVGYRLGVDYREISVGGPTSGLAALKAGTIDVAIFDPSFARLASVNHVGVLGVQASEFPVLDHAAFGAIITTEAYAKAHPDITAAVARSFADANNLILQNPKVAMPIIDQYFHTIPADILAYAIPQFGFNQNARATTQDWKNAAEIFVQNHLLPPTALDQVSSEFTNQYLPGG